MLGIDLKAPISAALDIPEIIAKIHAQDGLAVASHPHIMKSEWGRNTLYRDFASVPTRSAAQGFEMPFAVPQLFQERLPLQALNQ